MRCLRIHSYTSVSCTLTLCTPPNLLLDILGGVSLRNSGYVTCQGWPPVALMAVMMTGRRFLGSMVGFFFYIFFLPPLRVLMALSGSFADARQDSQRLCSACHLPLHPAPADMGRRLMLHTPRRSEGEKKKKNEPVFTSHHLWQCW